ncbi:ATP-grasp ribosomal peptide maturase [Glycomyces sp. NPDC047010]|uniref:ATP-grasp ribosomal peptide maturase n=1 Tax=Glycomyces sp. NPDC047010 TaxID=3155023 RepID=UPI0033D052EC
MSEVLILSNDDDGSADLVAQHLTETGRPPLRLDPGDFPLESGLSATILDSGGWRTTVGGIDLDQVSAVYYRRPTVFTMPEGMSNADRDFAIGEARRAFGGLLASLPARLWINRPEHNAAADYKPHQLHTAVAVGLTVPPTYIGNNREDALKFAVAFGPDLIAKTFQPRLVVEHGVTRTTWATAIRPEQLEDPAFTVTANLIQQRIEKDYEVRVTVVGARAFAVRIDAHSPAARTDFRSDYDALTYRLIDLPEDIARKLQSYMARTRLVFAAFDFAVTPGGHWVFFECNPNGQWGWLEDETGAAISQAIAELLRSEA